MAHKTAVAPMDKSRKNSPVSGPIESESTVVLKTAKSGCFWNDQKFSEGAQVESEGAVYECNYGQWVRQDT